MTTEAPQPQAKGGKMLFEDPMTGNWQEKWFLDGKKATLEHRDGGLCFFTPPSNVDKNKDRATFDAHHAGAVRLAFLLTGRREAAEDAVAEVWLKVHRRLQREEAFVEE